jgi:C-5 cytosine-specific DNA methylase/Protein of unknown function (DUF1778)
MLRLQGFPETFKIVVGDRAMRKLTGNSVAVPVIKAVAGEMMKAITQHQPNKRQLEYKQLNLTNQILETERTIVLSERDAQTVFDLLENPPTPDRQLLAAVNRHRAFSRENL